MGESGENTDQWIEQFVRVLEKNKVGWCFWPYKKLDATSCIASINRPAEWETIVTFANGLRTTYEEVRKNRPPKEKAQVKQPKPEPKLQLKMFEVIVRRTATQEQSVSVKAENEAAARAVSMEMVKKKRFDVGLTTMHVEVASLIEKTKA